MYGGMEEAKLHTLMYTPLLDISEWWVSCFSQGRVFWYLSARRLSKPRCQFTSSG